MKRTILWLVGGVVGALITLAIIGYFAGPAPAKVSEPTSADKLTQLNETLASHDLTLCDAYKWIGSMEAETRKELEEAAPDMNAVERDSMLNQVRALKWDKYRSEHQLPDSLMGPINVYGLQECK